MTNATSNIIALLLMAAIIGLVYLLAYLGETNTDVFKVLVGALVSVGFTNVVGFYFGSSVSSRVKDKTINTMAVNAPAEAAIVEAFTKQDKGKEST